MTMKSGDPEAPNRVLSSWEEIVECLGDLPLPATSVETDFDEGGWDIEVKEWVFRGLRSSCYELQPSIEREVKCKRGMEWPVLEELVSSEFKARARMHMSQPLIPDEGNAFTWLALMQHYAVPTRLLDFTYSPFVALYFAIRNSQERLICPLPTQKPNDREYVRLWAMNAVAVNNRFAGAVREVELASEEAWGEAGRSKSRALSLDPSTFVSQRDIMTTELNLHGRIARLFFATGKRRGVLERNGCVCVASPPAFNPRLVSQQGAFMFNCAEGLGFQDSLKKMMSSCKSEWCKTFDIPVELIPKIEGQLFQMNIHEQSLFPDMEGLAGFVRQKIRLHWK